MLPTPPEGLRHWRLADAPALEAAWADPSIRLWNPPPESADAASWIMRCEERWAFRLSVDFVIDVDGEVAGEVGLRNLTAEPARAELGIWVAPQHRKRGLGVASVVRVTEWAHDELQLSQVWCRTAVGNADARSLFARASWMQLGTSDDRIVWAH